MLTLVNLLLRTSRAQEIAKDIRLDLIQYGSLKKKAQTGQKPPPSGSPVLQITIRNLGQDGQPATEKTVYNWRAAWEIVDKAMWPRRKTQVYVTDLPGGMRPSRYRGRWFIDFTSEASSKG
jgi:hypothetical protein